MDIYITSGLFQTVNRRISPWYNVCTAVGVLHSNNIPLKQNSNSPNWSTTSRRWNFSPTATLSVGSAPPCQGRGALVEIIRQVYFWYYLIVHRRNITLTRSWYRIFTMCLGPEMYRPARAGCGWSLTLTHGWRGVVRSCIINRIRSRETRRARLFLDLFDVHRG